LMPRHSPFALISLTCVLKILSSEKFFEVQKFFFLCLFKTLMQNFFQRNFFLGFKKIPSYPILRLPRLPMHTAKLPLEFLLQCPRLRLIY